MYLSSLHHNSLPGLHKCILGVELVIWIGIVQVVHDNVRFPQTFTIKFQTWHCATWILGHKPFWLILRMDIDLIVSEIGQNCM